mmetsp:Transcript_2667/g.4498  ORF Transcript_2667/g.4498 Transcript_2667/m.4498 type:complete len:205 (-) Transcript_2667:747-1361(-)
MVPGELALGGLHLPDRLPEPAAEDRLPLDDQDDDAVPDPRPPSPVLPASLPQRQVRFRRGAVPLLLLGGPATLVLAVLRRASRQLEGHVRRHDAAAHGFLHLRRYDRTGAADDWVLHLARDDAEEGRQGGQRFHAGGAAVPRHVPLLPLFGHARPQHERHGRLLQLDDGPQGVKQEEEADPRLGGPWRKTPRQGESIPRGQGDQ